MTEVRIYGRNVGYGSYAQVTRGFVEGLASPELTPHLVALDEEGGEEEEAIPGALAPAAIYTAPLNQTSVMARNARHQRRYVMVAPNSDTLPLRLLQQVCCDATDLLTPSQWGATQLRASLERIGRATLPVTVVPHGVSTAFAPWPERRARVRAAYAEGHFRVLHLSSSDRQRKGTRELLVAWERALAAKILPAQAELILVLDVAAEMSLKSWMVDADVRPPPHAAFCPRLDLSPAALREAYTAAHLICQPSRGEGFGLCPLEARACGVPVAATYCTGHSEHIPEPGITGVVRVEHGPETDLDDLPGSKAPSVSPDAILEALRDSYRHWHDLEAQAQDLAPEVRRVWSWQTQLRPFAERLQAQ